MKVCPTCHAEYLGGEVFCPVDATRLGSESQVPSRTDPQDPLVGLTLGGRYKILRRIGEGGMGIVYEAEHIVIEKRVALKVLRDDFSSRSEVVERFHQEAKSASRIGHQHIVDISDFGTTPAGQSYFVMEHLEGEDLANVLARERSIPARRAASILLQCCRALGAAHAKGIVHRDMKPENIFLTTRDGETDFVKIVDFGIAKMSDIETAGAPGRKLTKTGMIFGTPEYMSPEQAAGKALDHRVDIYALGVILYEMLTGRVPFVGDSFMGILTQHMFEDVPPMRTVVPDLQCSAELEAVAMRALAKPTDKRFQSMHELGRAIATAMDMSGALPDEDTLTGYGEPVRPVQRAPRILGDGAPTLVEAISTIEEERPASRGRSIILSLLVLLVAGGATFAYLWTSQAPASPDVIATGPQGTLAGEPAPAPLPTSPLGTTAAVPSSPPPAAAPPVQIEVATRPSGAVVRVNDSDRGCASTPCSFEARVGDQLRIVATLDRHTATENLDVVGPARVEMRLQAPRGRGGKARADKATGTHPNVSASELKIPDAFRR